MKSRKMAVLLCVTLLMGILGGCGSEAVAPEATAEDTVVGVPVEVAAVSTQDFERVITIAGQTSAESTVNVIAKVAGMEQIMSVNVKVGDRVAKGQVLASLNTDTTNIQLNQAQLAYDNAQSSYDKYLALFDAGALSQDQLDQAKLQLDNAANNLNSAQLAIDYATVTAPISGTVVTVNADEGSYASASAPMFVIANVDDLEVKAGVTESNVGKISVGQKVSVKVGAASAEPVEGTITEISKVMDMTVKNYPITISIDNGDGVYMDGMYCEVKLVTDRAEGAVVIPAQAITNNDGNRYVFLAKEGKAVETLIQVGLTDGNYYVVTEGLAAGDELIVKGNSDLVDGQDIVVVSGSVSAAAEPSEEDLLPAEEPVTDNAGGDQE